MNSSTDLEGSINHSLYIHQINTEQDILVNDNYKFIYMNSEPNLASIYINKDVLNYTI